jgi:hypothetical protein
LGTQQGVGLEGGCEGCRSGEKLAPIHSVRLRARWPPSQLAP